MERRLAAIMLADVAGYSALMERDETRTFERVREMRQDLVGPAVDRYGGRIIKTTGDGFLAEFSSGTAAVLCGIDIQRLNHAREATRPEAERIHLRIGINLGDIIIDGGDVSGDGVNVAARLEPIAPIDGLCISGAVRDQIRENLDVVFEDLGEQQVKNISRPIRAYRINLASAPARNVPGVANRRARTFAISAAAVAVLALAGVFAWTQSGSPPAHRSAQTKPAPRPGEFAGIRISSALVIGNSKYAHMSDLANAGNDAIAISTALRLHGVPVTLKRDLTLAETAQEIASFRNGPDAGGAKLFFYAGHGWNIKGSNYLFPVDAPRESELLAGKGLEKVYPVADIYQGRPGRMLVLLDTHGDAVAVPDDVVLAFSGSPRHITQDEYRLPDGTISSNSPYAASLIEMLASTADNLPTAFLELAQRVEQKTQGKQIPWVSASIVGAGAWANGSSRSGPGGSAKAADGAR